MMSSDSESLSAEDLKNRLYHSLREKGLVDTLKSQLRNRLITELRQLGVNQDFSDKTSGANDNSLLHRAANSLVADHLRRCQYDYTLSVFLPECGIEEGKLFTARDLLQLLNINPHSKLYKNLSDHPSKIHVHGFLWQLLCEISQQHGNSIRESGCQTDGNLPPQDSLVERFNKLDEHYARYGGDHRSKAAAVEERILVYQRQLDERSRTEYVLEVARFKEQELSRMRLEEREKCQRELEASRKELERTYQTKSNGLLERERNSIERLQKQTEIQEKEVYSQRQSLLEEIEVVRQREADLRRQSDINAKEKYLLEDRIKSREDNIKKREDAVKRSELDYEHKLRDATERFKIEEQSRLLQKTKDIEFREMRLKENERRVDDDLRDIKQVKDELKEERVRVNQLEADLHRTKQELIMSQTTSESLSEKCREMVDYQMLKEENAVMKKELDSYKMRLTESQKAIMVERQKQEELLREMTEKASRPSPEIYLLQKEIDRLKSKLRENEVVGEHERYQVGSKLHEQIDRNSHMVQRFEEQTLQQKEMNQEISDLRQQLFHFKQALSNEMYRNPKIPTVAGRKSPSLCDVEDLPQTHLHDYETNTLVSESAPLNSQSDEELGLLSNSDDLSYSQDLVQETKRRLRSLEAEAENLEQNYRSFQYRMTTVPANMESMSKSVGVIGTTNVTRSSFGTKSTPVTKMQLSTPIKSSSVNTSQRPLSSTPYKSQNSVSRLNKMNEDKTADLDVSVSTVHSVTTPPPDPKYTQTTRTVTVTQNKAMSLSDLEAKPGEPSFMLETSNHGAGAQTATVETAASLPTHRISPSGQEGSETSTVVGLVSLDSAWKKKEDTDAERRRQEEEDREFEERRRKREEERIKREQEAWEREQRELAQLEGRKVQQSEVSEVSKEQEEEVKKEASAEPAIDPVMQKYMQMVAQQKQKEKQQEEMITQKAVGIWSKGRQFSEDKTPEVSASDEMSVADDKSAQQNSDGDFDW